MTIKTTFLRITAGALLTVLLFVYVAALFLLIVAVGSDVLGLRHLNPLLAFVAAASVAVTFDPIRRWSQRFTRDLLHSSLPPTSEILDEIERVVAEGGTDVLSDVAAITSRVTRWRQTAIWLDIRGALEPVATNPAGGEDSLPSVERATWRTQLPSEVHAVDVRVGSETVGLIGLIGGSEPSDEQMRVLSDVAKTSSALFSNIELQTELRRRTEELRLESEALRESARRIVDAQDSQRGALERDIHDGAQQYVTALAVRLGRAAITIRRDPPSRSAELQDVKELMAQVRDALAGIAAGIYPKVLTEEGPAGALAEMQKHLPFDLHVASTLGRYASDLEAAIYFICSEAIQNAAKHAKATRVSVDLVEQDGAIRFSIADDGVGLRSDAPSGAGLQNMHDRVAALGGRLSITTRQRTGTAVTGEIPVHLETRAR